jgi:DNA-binding PadR family transcriptional regulator
MPPAYLGEFEQIVLLALLRAGEDAYGMRIRREIEERTGREASIGAVYATLDRMENKGLVRSTTRAANADDGRGGRARRHFHLTAEGKRSLEASQLALARLTEGLDLGVAR